MNLFKSFIRALIGVLDPLLPRLSGRIAVYFFLKPLPRNYNEKDDEFLSRGRTHFLLYNEQKVYYHIWGKGTTVLIGHGWSGKVTQFRGLIEALVEKGYRVVAPDFPGHGRSEGKMTNVLEFKAIIQSLIVRESAKYFIGHSLSGLAYSLAINEGNVKLSKVVYITVHALAKDIIDKYIKDINGTFRTRERLVNLLQKKFNRSFNDFSASDLIANKSDGVSFLLVFDKDDTEVPFVHAEILQKACEGEIYVTEGLGHNRILKDEGVINRISQFLG